MDNNFLIKELEAKKQDIRSKAEKDIAQIDFTIRTLKQLSYYGDITADEVKASPVSDKYQKYDPKANLRDKIAFILKAENRFLHLRQIGDILHQLEPKIEAKDFVSKLYTPIGELKKEGVVYKYTIGNANANSFWGSVNWVDHGVIKQGYEYDADQVKQSGIRTPVEI